MIHSPALKLSARSATSLWDVAVVMCCGLGFALSVQAAPLDALQGIWTGKRTSDDGAELTQKLEILGDKLRYTLSTSDNEVRLFAKGIVKAERLGSFQVLKVTSLEAGRSESDIQAIDDERETIFVTSEDRLILASNFDKVRENQNPRVDVYTLKARPQFGALDARTEKLLGKWKLKVKMGEEQREYELNVEKGETGGLAGSVTSPRSGTHKLKAITFQEGQLSMELTREIQGAEALILYKGELKEEGLSGTFVVKGYEERYKGTWSGVR